MIAFIGSSRVAGMALSVMPAIAYSAETPAIDVTGFDRRDRTEKRRQQARQHGRLDGRRRGADIRPRRQLKF